MMRYFQTLFAKALIGLVRVAIRFFPKVTDRGYIVLITIPDDTKPFVTILETQWPSATHAMSGLVGARWTAETGFETRSERKPYIH